MSIWNTISAGIIKPKDGWMVDSESNNCLICGNIFSLTTRRHHCRFCYRLVCGTCSDHNLDLDDDGSRNRMCKECFTKLGRGGLVAQDSRFKNHNVVHFQVRIYNFALEGLIRIIGFIVTNGHIPRNPWKNANHITTHWRTATP